jgi:hypothetical protein
MRLAANSGLRQVRLRHQADRAPAFRVGYDLRTSVNILTVFVRRIVLALIGSCLMIRYVSTLQKDSREMAA